MSGSKTAYLAEAVLDHVLGQVIYTPPTDIWFVLSSTAFDPAATGGACNELTASDYARLTAVNDGTTWASATGAAPSIKSNLTDLAWPTASTDWGIPTAVYVADASTGGNLLYGADIAAADVAPGDTFDIPAGAFVFSED